MKPIFTSEKGEMDVKNIQIQLIENMSIKSNK